MPFTPAHPAILLPIIRWRYASATALIIGSMAPDFEYFFRMSVKGTHGHTLWGMLYFDLPVTFLLAWLFHGVVKRNAIHNMPVILQRKFQDTLALDFMPYFKRHAIIFAASALVGTASHLLWDSFTHNNGYFARELPIYRGTYVPYDGVNYPLFYALQNISTGVGLTIVLIYVMMIKPAADAVTYKPRNIYWILLVFITGAVVAVRFMVKPDYTLGNSVVCTISGLLLALVLCGLINFRNTVSS